MNWVGFLVRGAYFLATIRFFSIHHFHKKDIEYLAHRGGLVAERVNVI